MNESLIRWGSCSLGRISDIMDVRSKPEALLCLIKSFSCKEDITAFAFKMSKDL